MIGGKHFLTTPSLQFLNHHLHFLNLYLFAENQVESIIFSQDIADFRILQCDWFKTF